MQQVINLSRHSFTRYVMVGGTTFAIDFFLLVFMREIVGVPVVVAATMSYWTALAYNFTINKFWTFGKKENTSKHAFLYGSLVVFNFFTNIGIIWALGVFGVHYFVAKIIGVAVAMLWNYLAYKKLIFT